MKRGKILVEIKQICTGGRRIELTKMRHEKVSVEERRHKTAGEAE